MAAAVVAVCLAVPCHGQGITYGPSDPSDPMDCGQYQWPEVQSPCPEVQIKQKWDHVPLKQYRAEGWDTVVSCSTPMLTLSCMPYKPVQYFDGQYTVDEIPYNPPDPTFSLGTKMPVSTDDDFAAEATDIPFSFFFFGIQKNKFVLGANGLITFNTAAAGRYCPWKYTASIPWGNNTNGRPAAVDCSVSHMRDAIYGIYEDTHPIASYLSGNQGIYYGVQGEYPCRKIICSWNGIPTFPGVRNKDNRCTYQIVCYEGSNIIEVHVKRRGINTDWQDGRGLIGIQNATGASQVKGDVGTSTFQVKPGAYAAYYPEGCNLLTTTLEEKAYRFTPVGNTTAVYEWLRIFDDGRPAVKLPSIADGSDDTNGYYIPMGTAMASCPTLTLTQVSPTCVSRYVFHMRFADAAKNEYDLYDTITIGIDFSNQVTLRPSTGTAADTSMNICRGNNAQMILEFPQLQDTMLTQYRIMKRENGVEHEIDKKMLVKGNRFYEPQSRLNRIPMTLVYDSAAVGSRPNMIDTLRLEMIMDFISGCDTTLDIDIYIHPNYDTTNHIAICKGDTVRWHMDGRDYTRTDTTTFVKTPTVSGCDSVVRLFLLVYDTTHTIDPKQSCLPYTWLNGETYSADNTATEATDTVVLKNLAGCDSVVHLRFEYHPMHPEILADIDYFDYDQLQVTLSDVSTGGSTRRWLLPGSNTLTDPVVVYTADDSMDSVAVALVEYSQFGCIDTAYLTLPFHHDVLWMPNAFTPSGTDNNLFGPRSRHIAKMQMLIYNRFGSLVHRCDEVDCQWDGTDPDGNLCPQGAYVYIVRYSTEYDPHTTLTAKGTVTIVY